MLKKPLITSHANYKKNNKYLGNEFDFIFQLANAEDQTSLDVASIILKRAPSSHVESVELVIGDIILLHYQIRSVPIKRR